MSFTSDNPTSIASVTDRVRPITLPQAALGVYFLGERAVFIGAEEGVYVADGNSETQSIAVCGGAILSHAANANMLVLGCDDGKIVTLNADLKPEAIATDIKRRWIDAVAIHPDGAVAWSAGKTAFVRAPKGQEKSFDAPSTVGGLAFAPKGLRLAIAHYNGATLWFPNMAAKPEVLEWKGSHLGVTFSADNRFVVTAMHEAALHGWRLADGKHMRMTGYPSRVRSMSWSAGGKFLATSGADTAILWPFAGKDGPMGKQPEMLAPLQAKVTAVACHPNDDIFAAGYSDGTVLMVRIADGAEILVRRNQGASVSALGWNRKGTMLAFAAEDGGAGLLPL